MNTIKKVTSGQAKVGVATTAAAPTQPAPQEDKNVAVAKDEAKDDSDAQVNQATAQAADAKKLADATAAIHAADAGATSGEGKLFSSHPIASFRLGRFQFDKTLLRLKGKDLAEFEKMLASESLPDSERNKVKEIDQGAAESYLKAKREAAGGATKDFTSTLGADRPGAAAIEKAVKDGEAVEAFASTPQTDGNAPVVAKNGN